jgi:hypothetical protein
MLNATHRHIHSYCLECATSLVTRVAQKVMPHILFLGNYLFRIYEIHAEYNWMFPLHMLFFHMHALVLRWRRAVDVDGDYVEK